MKHLKTRFKGVLLVVAVLFTLQPAFATVKVPAGNRNFFQPPIPTGSLSRTRATNGSFEEKYERIRDLIASDTELREKITSAAKRYDIAPIHIVGALVGEHTYNVDALDRLQTYYVKAISYLNSEVRFAYKSETVIEFVKRRQFAKCKAARDSYDFWTCREDVWNQDFRGKRVDGTDWPNKRFGVVFFQPFFAGQTFGLGQINPLTALAVTDLVAKISGKRKLTAERANEVYATIMDPDSTLEYMAAVLKIAIDSYKTLGGYDISDNPGITATLYNLGDIRNRAKRARDKSRFPQENYYGWLINKKRAELEAVMNR